LFRTCISAANAYISFLAFDFYSLRHNLIESLETQATMIGINGWQTVRSYPSIMSSMSGGIPIFINKALGSLVAWIYYGRVLSLESVREMVDHQPRGLVIATTAVNGAFYLICLILAWRSRHIMRASRAVTIAVFGLVTTCLSPAPWRYAYTVAFIALAIYWVRMLRAPNTQTYRAVLLALTTFTLGVLFFDLAAGAALPPFIQIPLASFWIVFTVLFSLDALYHSCEDERANETTSMKAVYPG